MRKERKKTSKRNYAFFYNKYPRYREIQCYLRMLAREYPNRIRLECIGQSIQGRDIEMIVVSNRIQNQKPACLIDAGVHGREWLTNVAALYFIDYLIRNPKVNKSMDFYIIPCVNPDGYEFSHTRDRLWRKNMNCNNSGNPDKYGVDINRNFPYMFGKTPGSSNRKESREYHGECALSEPESKSLANIFSRYRKLLKLYISLHSHGNLILFPWGYTKTPAEDNRDLMNCGCACKKAMQETRASKEFRVGSIASCMYVTTGSSVDYARGCHNIKFCYTIELEKGGKSGFSPSTKRIVKIGEALAHGITAMVKYVRSYYKKKNKKCGCKAKRVHFARK